MQGNLGCIYTEKTVSLIIKMKSKNPKMLTLYRPGTVIRRKGNVRKALVSIKPMDSDVGSLSQHLHKEIQDKDRCMMRIVNIQQPKRK